MMALTEAFAVGYPGMYPRRALLIFNGRERPILPRKIQ
jgi:hypothetical protein